MLRAYSNSNISSSMDSCLLLLVWCVGSILLLFIFIDIIISILSLFSLPGDLDESNSCRSSACASPLPTFEVLDDNFNSTGSSSNYGVGDDDSERRTFSSSTNRNIVPVKATEITTSASLTPQRTASASINLTPSPKPGRARARSKSPAMHR